MSIKKNNKMFNLDKGQNFKVRKSKKYRNLCSFALGIMSVSGLATATVSADETVTPVTSNPVVTEVVTSSTETPTETTVAVTPVAETEAPVENSVSSTNLTEVQPKPTLEATQTQNASDTQSGYVVVTNGSDSLNEVVSAAEQAGVVVKKEATKDYGVTTSAEETAQKQTEIQADYANQTKIVKKVTDDYVAEKEKHEVAANKVIAENTQLKAEYDGQVLAYNQEVAKVNRENAAIDAAYEKARQAYESEVANITASNAEAKEKYEKALANYKSEVERINKVNEEKRVAYEKMLAGHNLANTTIEAENKLIEQRNQVATAAYNKALEIYNAEKAKYNKAITEAKALTIQEGYLSKIVPQTLTFESEPNAYISSLTTTGKKFKSGQKGQDAMTQDAQNSNLDIGILPIDFKTKIEKNGNGVRLEVGDTMTVVYSGLTRSTSNGEKITSVKYVYTLKKSSLGFAYASANQNPTVTLHYYDLYKDSRFELDVTYYGEDGAEILPDGLVSFSSLNNSGTNYEYITNFNGEIIPITGSSISQQADNRWYSKTNNENSDMGSRIDGSDWDKVGSGLEYYGATAGLAHGHITVEFGSVGRGYIWYAFNSDVKATGGIISTPPKKPTLVLENPKTITSTSPVTPTYEKLPEAPSVSYLETPEAPTKPTPKPLPEEPEVPTYKELPKAPEAPTVSYRLGTLRTQPQTSKEVETIEGLNVDKGLVAKGQNIVFDLLVDPLSSNRSLTTSGELTDPLPAGFELDLEKTVNANSAYELTYNVDKHILSGNFTKELVLDTNRDLAKSFILASLKVYGRVLNDAATYKNAYRLTLNGGDGKVNGYTRTSNLVVVHTPGDPNDPDNPTNNKITPLKANTNALGVKIDGKVVPIGGVNYYTITLDYDQYNTVTPDKDVIAKGFAAFDDYPEEALQVDLSKANAIDSDGNAVSSLIFVDNKSVATSTQTVQTLLAGSGIGDKITGAFISVTADDPQAYYNAIIKAKKSVTITIPMVVKDSLYNTGKSYSNTAYQLDFGNGYKTNTVTNTTPVVTPTKVNTNASGAVINGKYVLANSVNYYKVSLDYSHYKGIEADASLIAQGFFGVDDVPEEALIIENSGIQLIASDNSVVKGMTTNVYANLLEAPKALQEAMVKRGYTPKGVILVASADDPQAFYDTYVKTGMTITATLPMTVKADMAKTGGNYENTAYQVDFGTAYITETVVNNVPKLDPKKDVIIDLSHAEESLAGKDIEAGTVFNYKLSGAELPADRGSEIYAYTWYDNYDEKHDQYDGVYKIFAAVDFETEDGTKYTAGTELTRFSIQTVNTVSGEVDLKLDEDFLRSVKDLSAFKADAYLQMKRIATGDVHNTYTHGVNDARVEANTVTTHTPVGNVLVNFIEDGTGKVLKAQVVDEKEVATGTAYDTTDRKEAEIVTEDGKTYEMVRIEGQEQGRVVKGDTVINYIYKEVLGDVTVAYKDKDGKVIKDPVIDTETGSTGRDYDTTDNKPVEIVTTDGKTYKLVPELTEGKETGKVGKGNTTITYVYEEVKADVLVNYVDEDGNVIKEQVKDVDQGSTGTDYDTTDNKPEYIEVNGVKYKLMPKKTIGKETGKLSKSGAEVTYVYHKIVTNWIEEGTKKNLKPQEDGEQDRGSFDGYDYVTTEVNPETGDITHIFKTVSKTTTLPPVTPTPETPQPQQPTPVAKTVTLPSTGEMDSAAIAALGFVALTGATGLVLKPRRKEEN